MSATSLTASDVVAPPFAEFLMIEIAGLGAVPAPAHWFGWQWILGSSSLLFAVVLFEALSCS